MYNLEAQQFDNAFDVLVYTITSMKECGYSDGEIDDYIADATSSHNMHLIESSMDVLDECNKVYKHFPEYSDSWRDYYYKDDCAYSDYLESDVDDCTYFDLNNNPDKPNHYWEDDDIYCEDDLEAYEGFDSCKNHQYCCDGDSETDVFDFVTNWR